MKVCRMAKNISLFGHNEKVYEVGVDIKTIVMHKFKFYDFC